MIRSVSSTDPRHSPDIFATMVDIQWRWTVLIFTPSFVLSWLASAVLWWLIACCPYPAAVSSNLHFFGVVSCLFFNFFFTETCVHRSLFPLPNLSSSFAKWNILKAASYVFHLIVFFIVIAFIVAHFLNKIYFGYISIFYLCI